MVAFGVRRLVAAFVFCGPGSGIKTSALPLARLKSKAMTSHRTPKVHRRAGASVFPTAGCANPTLTIVALALRLSDRLKTILS